MKVNGYTVDFSFQGNAEAISNGWRWYLTIDSSFVIYQYNTVQITCTDYQTIPVTVRTSTKTLQQIEL